MNLRFWGGWFLAIACVCIFLTMGCDKGHLGVKSSAVTGRLVDKANPSVGVANATVRMMSKETVGSSDLPQGYNFLSTTTDEDGYFFFEKVNPDNVIFEFQAPGYHKVVYPSDKEEDEGEGKTAPATDIDSVSIAPDSTVNLANIFMEKIGKTLPATIDVKFEFVDNNGNPVPEELKFEVTLNGVTKEQTAGLWKVIGYTGLSAATTVEYRVRNTDSVQKFKICEGRFTGDSSQVVPVTLEALTCKLAFNVVNLPDYINDTSMNIIVETPANGAIPAKEINKASQKELDKLVIVDVDSVSINGSINAVIRMPGYRDEIVNIPASSLKAGDTGTFRIDIDFTADDSAFAQNGVVDFGAIQNSNAKLGMLDNRITRDVALDVVNLEVDAKVKIITNLPNSKIEWGWPTDDENIGQARVNSADYGNNPKCLALLKDVPVGYTMQYRVVVTNTTETYILPLNGNLYEDMIEVPSESEVKPFAIVIDGAKRVVTE